MTTIKSFTDLEQSKKLAEILHLESADMFYHYNVGIKNYYEDIPRVVQVNNHFVFFHQDVPCWSLAALLEQFEDTAGLARDYGLWFCYDNRKSYCTKHYDNPIDACYEMIVWVKENNKL